MKKFKTADDLYENVLPALKSKLNDLHYQKYVAITIDDIWNYLVDTKWSNSPHLELSDIIDDIMNVDGYYISEYINKQLRPENRNKYFKEDTY